MASCMDFALAAILRKIPPLVRSAERGFIAAQHLRFSMLVPAGCRFSSKFSRFGTAEIASR